MTDNAGRPGKDDFSKATQMVLSWDHPLLISHERADGDALGCLIALQTVLEGLGKKVTAAVFEPPVARYKSMEGIDKLHVISGGDDAVLSQADGVILMDTCSFGQVVPIADWLRDTHLPSIAVDHHSTADVPVDARLIDCTAPSATAVLYRWVKAAGWTLPGDAARSLFVGLTTDTGWFQYSNTTPEAFRIAAELVEDGVSVDCVYRNAFMNEPTSKLRLRGAALSGIELLRDESVAIIKVTPQMFEETQSGPFDTEELVNIAMPVGSVEVSVLLVDAGNGTIKCSFRSKGAVNVAELAAGFGGGGHVRAAGARIPGSLSEVKQAILDRLDHT